MRNPIERLFKEHESPAHASKQDVHDALAKIHRLVANVQKQVLEYRQLTTEAHLHPEQHPALEGKLEFVYQTFSAMEREATALADHGRQLAAAVQQLDRVMPTWQEDIERFEAAEAADASGARLASIHDTTPTTSNGR